jgi:hypothetical protein
MQYINLIYILLYSRLTENWKIHEKNDKYQIKLLKAMKATL